MKSLVDIPTAVRFSNTPLKKIIKNMKATFTIFVLHRDLKAVMQYQKCFEDSPQYFINSSLDSNVPKIYFEQRVVEKTMCEYVQMNVCMDSFINWAYYNEVLI